MRTPCWMKLLTLAAVAALLPACDQPQAPEPKGDTVITLGEAEHLTVVDVESGQIVTRPGPISRFSGFIGVSADSQTLYVLDTKPPGPDSAALIGLDTRSLRILWREPWHALLTAPWTTPTRVLDGTETLLPGMRNGVPGVTAYDTRTRERVGFFGPVTSITGARRVPPSSDAPAGLVLVGGARTVNVIPSVGFLFVLDGATLDVRDSVLLVPSSPNRFGGVRQVLPAPDGRHAYVQTDNRIVRYDLIERRIVASVGLPSLAAESGEVP